MKESTLKGLFHASLVVAALVEMRTATTNMRRLLLGACAGWHASATYDHFVREPRTVPIIDQLHRKAWEQDLSRMTEKKLHLPYGYMDSLHDEEENG
jgi:hypothetical protein